MENERFAWLPKRVTSGKWVWFKTYYEHVELYDRNTGRAPITTFDFRWTETAKERTWRLLKDSVVHNRNVWNDTALTKEDKLYEQTTIQSKYKNRLS
jgi:hypothetical protein